MDNFYPVKQLQPNHADHISYYKEQYLNDMFKNEKVIAQRKYDGERMLIHFDHGNAYCTSRRFSKKTGRYMENQDKLEFLQDIATEIPFDYCVIDCECYSTDWSTIAGILHSLPERAKELQKHAPVYFACFDCLYFDGVDIREQTYSFRKMCLDELLESIKASTVDQSRHFHHAVEYNVRSLDEVMELRDFMIDRGYEGIVVKSLDRKYYDKGASLKCKRFETLDVVVCGYDQGRGKYSNTIGALHIGYYEPKTDSIIKISNVNCSTDAERDMWRDNWEELKNSVIEIKCQEITNKSVRHPVYLRLRKDKDYKMCTKETIFKE